MLWDSPPPSALVQLPVVLETLALGVSPGRPLPEAVLIPRWHLRHTWDSHLGPCRSPRPISLQAPLPCLGSLGCSRQASRGGVGHPARRPRAVAQHSGLAGSPSRHPGVGRAREAARPQRPGFPEGPQPAPQAWQPAAGLGDRPRGSSEPWPPAGPAQGWEWVRPKVALRGVEREGARNNHLTAL